MDGLMNGVSGVLWSLLRALWVGFKGFCGVLWSLLNGF